MRTGAIGLVVASLDRMIEFYARLGFHEEGRIRRDEPWAADLVGIEGVDYERVVLLHDSRDAAIELMHILRPEVWTSQMGIPTRYVTLWTDDIEKAQRTAFASGGRMVSKRIVRIPRGPEEGVKVVRVADPEHNVIEFREPAKRGKVHEGPWNPMEFRTIISDSARETGDPVP